MTIRKATTADYIHIVRSIQNKKLDYFNATHVRADIECGRCYVAEEQGKLIASMSLVYDATHNYHAMKRLSVFSKKNNGRGLASMLIAHLVSECKGSKIGCTPWTDNTAMHHILEKQGFKCEYIFAEKWCFYSKTIS